MKFLEILFIFIYVDFKIIYIVDYVFFMKSWD